MADLEKYKKDDALEHSKGEFKKLALSFIPGGGVLESVLDYQSNLKQKRIIDFSSSVHEVLSNIAGRELHARDFKNEDFIDIMESVFKKVLTTKSKYKLERFRNILVVQIVQPIEAHESLKYVQILDELQDIDLVILSKMRDKDRMSYMSNFQKLLTGNDGLMEDDEPVEIVAGDNTIIIAVGDIEFYVNRLISLGLLKLHTVQMASTVSRSRKVKSKNYKTILISKMGKKFLDFIENGATQLI